MLVASIPAKFSIPWANSAGGSYINAIPTNSQIGITAGAASLTDGFPPTTMQTGGTPPAGPDFNGILKWVTQWAQWQAAGAPVAYDSTFQTAVSGYPLGAVVASATTFGVSWMSTVDANATNPDTGGAGWVKIKGQGPYYAADTGTANALAISVPAISALAPGQLFIIKKYSAANTGAVTLNVNALGAVSVVWPDGTVLIAGDWPANVTGLIEYDGVNMNVLSVMGPSVFARKSVVSGAVVYCTTSQTPTVPAWATRVRSKVWGGGGGGGSASASGSGAGGNGGGYSEGIFSVVPGASLTVTVGVGGAGYVSTTGQAGAAGGTSSVTGFVSGSISATGGSGGGGSNSAGAVSGLYGIAGASVGIGSGGSINIYGDYAANSYNTTPPIGSAGAGAFCSSAGAISVSGGLLASFPGGGGGGSANGYGGVAGANGLVILEFLP